MLTDDSRKKKEEKASAHYNPYICKLMADDLFFKRFEFMRFYPHYNPDTPTVNDADKIKLITSYERLDGPNEAPLPPPYTDLDVIFGKCN
ncbi:hypothetical protein TVAG_306380 [Trichomonas vaginalis G3]|uniref:Uncharacterized protein n=1 Tax=Trichomonas vaginalis (strain ATCC PRA-98 / G3) TaxID=412133 RepID=A2DNC8_TRIV3|nr:hypothetical protein TVAGG3_1024530 [Trichomonas vaginalis G3]EAY18116.1 hypothetical protein TVAG_306380 [Trichomonas vaginalis G3]KAI5492393.1 hypothetical protein TVAGG3_1024530 [Trichomonas vaginalis G3]|eukprot:XP_001579102.1 hypothetical protein [Trichomonas vaginalis G3]